MSIDWEADKITSDQHRLDAGQLTPMVKTMEAGQVAYIEVGSLVADATGGLWLDPDADIYPAAEAEDIKDDYQLLRLIMIEDGPIVDASEGDFILDPGSEDTVTVDTALNYESTHRLPVIGLVGNDAQREQMGRILFEQYGIMLAKSVLASMTEAEPEDSSAPGDEEMPA